MLNLPDRKVLRAIVETELNTVGMVDIALEYSHILVVAAKISYKFSPYQKEVIELTGKILKRHSILTAGIRIDKPCERIRGKEELTLIKDKMKELNLKPPSSSKMEEAKEKLITLIKENYSRQKQNIPVLQNLRTLMR